MREFKFKYILDTAIGEYTTKPFTLDEILAFSGLEDMLENIGQDFGDHDNDAFFENEIKIISKLQYAGFKDKKGIEVWEGDSVKIYRHSFDTHKHEKQTRYIYKPKKGDLSTYTHTGYIDDVRVVTFIAGALCLRAYDGCQEQVIHFNQMDRPGQSIEVIGNKELLKGE